MERFCVYKLYLLLKQSGDIVSSNLLNRYVANIKMDENLVEGLKARNYADHGYIRQKIIY